MEAKRVTWGIVGTSHPRYLDICAKYTSKVFLGHILFDFFMLAGDLCSLAGVHPGLSSHSLIIFR